MSAECALYLVTHVATGMSYVGISTQPETRWRHHVQQAARGRGRMQRALRKYGKEAFTWEVVEWLPSVHQAKLAEKIYIACGLGHYNLTAGGDGVSGWRHTEESAAKIKAAWTPEKRAAAGQRSGSRKLSAETRNKISAAKTGVGKSEETKQKMRLAKQGKPLSDAHRASLRVAAQKRILGQQQKPGNTT